MDALNTLAAAAAAAAAADEDEGSGLAVQPHNSHAVSGAGGAAGEEDEQAAGAPARNEQGQGPENVAADPQSPACNSHAVSGRGGHVGQKRPAKGLLEPPRSGKVAKGGSLRVKGVWTDTDDLALMVAHVAHGNRWSVISTLLPTSRSDSECM